MKTVWIYVDTRYHVGHPDNIKAIADHEAANDPEASHSNIA